MLKERRVPRAAHRPWAGREAARQRPGAAVDAAGAADVLGRHREVTVLCHVRPDADALGMGDALASALNKEVTLPLS